MHAARCVPCRTTLCRVRRWFQNTAHVNHRQNAAQRMRGDRLSVPAPRTSLSLKHAHACRHADYAAWGPADVACQDMPSHDAHIYVAKPSAGSTCVRHNERLPVRSKNRSLKGRSAGCEGLHSEYRQGTVPSMRHATPEDSLQS